MSHLGFLWHWSDARSFYLVPVVDIDAHAQGEEVVEYVYPVKEDKWFQVYQLDGVDWKTELVLWSQKTLQRQPHLHEREEIQIEAFMKKLWTWTQVYISTFVKQYNGS